MSKCLGRIGLGFVAACSSSPAMAPATHEPSPAPQKAPALSIADQAVADASVREMLGHVARARGLPVKGPILSKVLSRNQMIERIRKHIEAEIPLEVVEAEGEALVALGVVPTDYDFLEGAFALLKGRIAGFYEPKDKTMYLMDDLTENEANETLAHELVHALQDQSFSLVDMLKFKPGETDRTAAAHALMEGDATSAMLDVVAGDAFRVSDSMLRKLLTESNANSSVGGTTPRVLQSSLVAPYADGFAFVQAIRQKGGWPAVDAVYGRLPETTEQLLHPDKYAAQEKAIPLPKIAVDALGAGWKRVLEDDMGEQDLRILLEEWTSVEGAKRAAAGWGGDRYALARLDDPKAPKQHTVALGWHLTFDTQKDAREAADVLASRFPGCQERKALGPFAWKLKGKDLAVVGGPYHREGKQTRSAGDCALANRWIDAILKAP